LGLRRWRQALSGAGSVVLIAGEPGIGKSRLVRELRGRLAVPSATTITCFCSPYHRDSAYFPIIRHLEGAAGIERGDTGERRQVKLAALLRETETPADAAALLAELLAAPVAEPSPVRDLGPRERRDRTRDALVGQAVALARRRPLLVVFEDAHWSDPTSLEVLDALVERIASLPVLLLVTFRPEFVPPWAGRPRVSSIVLNALDGSEAADMVGHLLGGSAEERLSRAIVDRSGGNPLCVEELSRVARDGEGMALPASLRDSLMARLDRLPAAKAAAQLGAAIGRSFDHALAAAIADMPREELDRGLDALVASGLAGRRGTGPDAIYTFKHVLVQEAAYDTLPRSRRAAIHARIVDALIAQDSTIADFQADLLAHHCKQAGDNARAAAYLIRAGWLSQYRAAYREATEQFNEVLRLVSVMPEGAARDLAELRARRGIGLTIGNSAGYASSQSGSNMFRAAELCERLDYPPEFAGVAFGLHVFHIQRADLAQASDVGERLLAWGRSRDDIRGQVLGHYCAGGVAVIQGELAAARSHLECAVDLYQANLANPAVDWSYRTATSGPRTWGNIHGRLAWIACWSGHLDRVATHISQADRYDEPEVVVITEAINGWLRIFTMSFVNDPASLSEATGALIAYSRQHDLPLFEAQATVLHGYAVARQGDPSSGQGMISEGLAAHAATGSVLYAVYFRALLAETHQMLGEPDVSLSLLNDAISSAEQSGEKWYLAELHRRAAEAYRQLGDDVAAEESFARALAVARRQGARLWELRAATSRARMLHDRGDDAGAAAVLRPVYACFTEGFATVPLREARALLDALDGEAAVRASVTV